MWPGTGGSHSALQLQRVQKQWQKWPAPPISASSEFASSAVSGFAVEQNMGIWTDDPETALGRLGPELPGHQNCCVLAAMASVNLRNAHPARFQRLAESMLAKNEQILTFPPSLPHTSFDTFGRLVTSLRPPKKVRPPVVSRVPITFGQVRECTWT